MIVGFNFDKISIERKQKSIKNMSVKYNLDFSDVKEEKLAIKTAKGVSFFFDFTVKYNPGVVDLIIKGHITFMQDEKKIKEILDSWNQYQKIPKDVSVQLFNFVLTKCNIQALELTQSFNLPPHIQMPTVKLFDPKSKDNPEQYIG